MEYAAVAAIGIASGDPAGLKWWVAGRNLGRELVLVMSGAEEERAVWGSSKVGPAQRAEPWAAPLCGWSVW